MDKETALGFFREVEQAYRGTDDRKLWFAWKRAFKHRFWTGFGAMSPRQVCLDNGLPQDEILNRVVAYEMSRTRVAADDEAELLAMDFPRSNR